MITKLAPPNLPKSLQPQKIIDPKNEINFCLHSFDLIMNGDTNVDYPMLYYIIYHISASTPHSHSQTLINETKEFFTLFVKKLSILTKINRDSYVKEYLICYNQYHKGIIKINKISKYLNRISNSSSIYDIGLAVWKDVLFSEEFLKETSNFCLSKFETLRVQEGFDGDFLIFLSSLQMIDPLYYKETLLNKHLIPQMTLFYSQKIPSTYPSFNVWLTEILRILNWEMKWSIKEFKEAIIILLLERKDSINDCLVSNNVRLDDLKTFYSLFKDDTRMMDEIIIFTFTKISSLAPFNIVANCFKYRKTLIGSHMQGDPRMLQSLKECISESLVGRHEELAIEFDAKIKKSSFFFDVEFYLLQLFYPKNQVQFLSSYLSLLRRRILVRDVVESFIIEDQLIRKFPLSISIKDVNCTGNSGSSDLILETRDQLIKMKRIVQDYKSSSPFRVGVLDPLISISNQWIIPPIDLNDKHVEDGGGDGGIPRKIKEAMERVEKEYRKKFPKRSLRWIPSFNRVLVCLQNGSEVWMNLSQYRILAKFTTSRDRIPIILDEGGMICDSLNSLLNVKILKMEDMNEGYIVVNEEYSSDIIDISDVIDQSMFTLSPTATNAESSPSHTLSRGDGDDGDHISEEKKAILQAMIMRIIKKETRISPQALYASLGDEGSSSPSSPSSPPSSPPYCSRTSFKEIMSGLMEKDFVEFLTNQNVYQYIA